MQLLITGSSSTIGRSITRRLLDAGHAVVAFDRAPSPLRHARLNTVTGDVRDRDALAAAARGCDTGLHLAALSGAAAPHDLLSVNVLGAHAFLQTARQLGLRMSVVASSAPVHLPPSGFDLGLDDLPGAADDYDLSQQLQDVLAAHFHARGVPVHCLRLGHVVHGARRQNLGSPLPLDQLQYCRGGWVALEDVIEALVAALSAEPDTRFRVYNVVGSRSARARFAVAATEARFGMALRYDFAAYEANA